MAFIVPSLMCQVKSSAPIAGLVAFMDLALRQERWITDGRASNGLEGDHHDVVCTSNRSSSSFSCLTGVAIVYGAFLTPQIIAAQSQIASRPALPSPPETRSPLVLTAINDPRTGKMAFS